MPDRRGKLGDVDLPFRQDVFKDGAIFHKGGGDAPLFLEVVLEKSLTELLFGKIVGKAQGHVAPFTRKDIDEHPKSFGATGHFVKNNRRPVVGPNDDVRRKTDILLPRRSQNRTKLTQTLGLTHPLAQVAVA